MKLSSVRPSVCLSVHTTDYSAAAAGLLLWAGGQKISIVCCTTGAHEQMRAVSRYQLT